MTGERVAEIENLQARKISVELAMLAKLVDSETAKTIHSIIAKFADVCQQIKELNPALNIDAIQNSQAEITKLLVEIGTEIRNLSGQGLPMRKVTENPVNDIPETLTDKSKMKAFLINAYQGDVILDLKNLIKEVSKKTRYYSHSTAQTDSPQRPSLS